MENSLGQHATEIPWVTKVKGSCYGTDETYKRAAKWLRPCHTVADWGASREHFRQFITADYQTYIPVDGTKQTPNTVVASLKDYHEFSEGILLRHVLEMTHDWQSVLINALSRFTKRMVVITFTPEKLTTGVYDHHLTWPVYHFNHKVDLVPLMEPWLVATEPIRTTQPERLYFLEKL